LDNETSSLVPLLKTSKDLERHASEIHIFAKFYKFQDEFWNACMDCEIEDRKSIDEGFITVVDNTLLEWHSQIEYEDKLISRN